MFEVRFIFRSTIRQGSIPSDWAYDGIVRKCAVLPRVGDVVRPAHDTKNGVVDAVWFCPPNPESDGDWLVPCVVLGELS